MDVQSRIYSIMRDKKMKQSLVAEAAGYTAKEFNNMLRKRKSIKPEDILPICAALNITPNDLFGWNDPNTSKTKLRNPHDRPA